MKTTDEIRRETEALVREDRHRRADFRALDRLAVRIATMPRPRPQLALVPNPAASTPRLTPTEFANLRAAALQLAEEERAERFASDPKGRREIGAGRAKKEIR